VRGGDDVRRSFSLCTSPASRVLRIGVKRLPGGAFSDEVVGALKVGDHLDVMTPAGSFTVTPDPDATRHHVAIAAGSGITPVLSIVAAVLEEEPQSFVTVVYANRTSRSVMFLDDLHDLKDRFPTRVQLIHVLSREAQEVELLSGRLDAERLARILDAFGIEGDDYYLCGPHQMIIDLRTALAERGTGRVHVELFHADPVPSAPAARIEGADAEGSAEVTIRLDGRSSTFRLRPDGPPVLEAALSERSDLPFACKGGVCGTCRARLVEGTVQMDANYALEPEEIERGYVLTCQSHPTAAEVVLDYDG
jgi:ring-1,2-phenylacetyl-CoA epoxidase subunit PaaE